MPGAISSGCTARQLMKNCDPIIARARYSYQNLFTLAQARQLMQALNLNPPKMYPDRDEIIRMPFQYLGPPPSHFEFKKVVFVVGFSRCFFYFFWNRIRLNFMADLTYNADRFTMVYSDAGFHSNSSVGSIGVFFIPKREVGFLCVHDPSSRYVVTFF